MLDAAFQQRVERARALPAFLILAILIGVVAVGAARIGLAMFSPDSWTYQELANTVFNGEFYRFSTQRSYLPGPYSASFPLAYPVLLAAVRWLAGPAPQFAIALNVVIAALSWTLVRRIALTLGVQPLAAFALACSLLLSPNYLDEVFSGRSIPAALLFFLAGVRAWQAGKWLACGAALGLAAITRFDFLVFGLLFQFAAAVLDPTRRRGLPWVAAGFLLGLSPWIAYSLTHFGKAWASDNSWVAMSANPSYVLDYPPMAGPTASTDPRSWLFKLWKNAGPTASALLTGLARMPLLLLALAWLLLRWRALQPATRRQAAWLVLLLAAATAPYLLTGYADARYFSFHLLVGSAGLLYFLEKGLRPGRVRGIPAPLLALAVAVTVWLSGSFLISSVAAGEASRPRLAANRAAIERLAQCHAHWPDATYVFSLDIGSVGTQYGAQTGRRAALLASNFARMTESQKQDYLQALRPYVLLNPSSLEAKECPTPTR